MKLDEALAVVLYLQDRPQTDMTKDLRDTLARAWLEVGDRARITIAREKNHPCMSRQSATQKVIDEGDVAKLLRLAEGYPCACMGPREGEPECFCKMNSKQVREAVSLAALRRGKLVRLPNGDRT